jgi:hypothetical protein
MSDALAAFGGLATDYLLKHVAQAAELCQDSKRNQRLVVGPFEGRTDGVTVAYMDGARRVMVIGMREPEVNKDDSFEGDDLVIEASNMRCFVQLDAGKDVF